MDWRLLLSITAGLCYGVEIIAIGQVVKKNNRETTMFLEMSLVAVLLFPVTFFSYRLDFYNTWGFGFSWLRCDDSGHCLSMLLNAHLLL